MSHELDMTGDRANMAYIGEKPWHGLGAVMQADASIDDWTKAAGLDWSVCRVPSGFMMGEEFKPDGKFTLIRDDTFSPLGNFSERYKIVQPSDIMAFFRDFILTDERFTMETAGSLYGGKKVWGLARFTEDLDVMGEQHALYVMLSTSFDGTLATTAQATAIRVVCKNTLQASLFSKDAAKVSIRHNVVWDEKAASRAHAQLEQVSLDFPKFKALGEALAMQRMSREQTEQFFRNLIDYNPKAGEEIKRDRKKGMLDSLMQSFAETLEEGTERNNAYTAFNAVTRFVDHDRSTRRTTDGDSAEAARMASSFFGSGAQMKARALELLAA